MNLTCEITDEDYLLCYKEHSQVLDYNEKLDIYTCPVHNYRFSSDALFHLRGGRE